MVHPGVGGWTKETARFLSYRNKEKKRGKEEKKTSLYLAETNPGGILTIKDL